MGMMGVHKALVIDSDSDIVSQVFRVLKRCGAVEIVHCTRLRAAGIRISTGESFDAIIVDVDVDEVGTDSVASLLSGNSKEGISRTPVLFIAEAQSRQDVRKLQNIGCYHFLMKPLNDEILESHIHELSSKKNDPEHEKELASAIAEAIKQENITMAEKLIKPALRTFPASMYIQILLAELFFYKGDIDSAQSITKKILHLTPGFAPAIEFFNKLNNKIEANDRIKKQSQEEQNRQNRFRDAQALSNDAIKLAKQENFTEAFNLFDMAIKKSQGIPTQYTILFNAANTYFLAKDFVKARELCVKCKELCTADYNLPDKLLIKITVAEDRVSAATQAMQTSTESFVNGSIDGVADMAMIAQSGNAEVLLNSEEELRILKYIMFEGKY